MELIQVQNDQEKVIGSFALTQIWGGTVRQGKMAVRFDRHGQYRYYIRASDALRIELIRLVSHGYCGCIIQKVNLLGG